MKKTLALVLSLWISQPAQAATNLSGLWFNPSESGWGLSLDNQPGFLFAALFVYGPDGNPTWYVGQFDASDSQQMTFSGPMFSTTGTPFSRTPFVSTDTKITQVGTATFALSDPNHARLTYSINGVAVDKNIQRQVTKALSIVGTYTGIRTTGPFTTDDTSFAISSDGTTLLISRTASSGVCRYSGAPQQFGMRLVISGSYTCSDFSQGTWSTADLTLLDDKYLAGTVTTRVSGTAAPTSQNWVGIRTP
jgi:hypothetical protein